MKYIRQLMIPLIILGVLTFCLVTYLVVHAVRMNSINKTYQPKSYEVCAKTDVQAMTITSADGEKIEYVLNSNGGLESASHNDVLFTSSQIEAQAVFEQMESICTFYYDKDFNLSDGSPAEYGLDSDKRTITIKKTNGNTVVLHCGNALPDKSGMYVRVNDEQTVYIASTVFYRAATRNFQDVLSYYVLGYTKADVYEVEFNRRSTEEKMIIRPEEDYDNGIFLESRYSVQYPVQRDPSDTLVALMDKMLDLKATGYVAISDSDVAAYGLDNPEYTFDITLNSGEKTQIVFSRELNGYYYGHCSTNPYYFRVLVENLRGLNTPVYTLIDAYVHLEYLENVRSIKGTIGDTSFSMEIFLDSTYSITSETTILKLDQRNAKVYSSDGSCYGLLLFGSICQMRISDVDPDAKPTLEKISAEFTVVCADQSSYSIKLVERNSESYYCFVDDRYSGFIVDRSVLYKDNGHEMTGFGVWDAYNLVNEAIDNQDAEGFYNRP